MALGLFIAFTSDFVECRRLLEEGVAVGQEAGEAAELYVALCRRYIGFVAMFEGNLPEARAIFEELLAYHRRVASEGRDRNNRRLASMLVSYSELAYAEGNLDEALHAVHEALPLMRASGDQHGLAAALDKFARIALVRGDLTSALAYWEEGVACSKELNIPMSLMECMEGIGAVHALCGEPARAAILFGAVAAFRQRTQVARRAIYIDLYDDIMAEAAAALGQSEYDRLLRIGQGMTLEEALDAADEPGPAAGNAPWTADAHVIPIRGGISTRSLTR